MKILIVDDSQTELSNMKYIVERLGHQAITAKDGYEGYEKTVSESPDLIFLDIVMPKMDGYELCKKISSDEKTKNIPIVLVSSRKDQFSLFMGKNNGASDFITKPYHQEDIIERISKFQISGKR